MTVGSQVKQTLASLRGSYGIIRLYAEQARHGETRSAFGEAAREMEEIVADLEERVGKIEFEEPQFKGL